MELKEYQHRTLEAFVRWRKELDEVRGESQRQQVVLMGANLAIPDEVFNYPRKAWLGLAAKGEVSTKATYVDRADGAGRPVPHVCFKIPTGGGKTLLGAAALERLGIQSGLVLWIVPTRAIYMQARSAFWNRQHPYRQMLERASGGRAKMLEKDDRFTRDDIQNYLCVMLLMLPATNRQKGKEFLRMFRDSGRYHTFFPDVDDERASRELLGHEPDLELAGDNVVKHSLFNVFKMTRPVVILDEAHKAYGGAGAREFVQSVNRLNPQLVIELSATPNPKISNLLVDISGVDLRKEEMIKLPVQITSFQNVEWRDTLAHACDKLEQLQDESRALEAEEGRYIRPLAVVRVERTGREQRDGKHIHAEDVREWLIRQLGVAASAVRVKSAENDEIGNEDLLSEFSQVRWIITKSALMEGWDCPFAYMLVMLDNTRSETALTQLLGRVMRQPHARRTHRDELDKCYVFCRQIAVDEAIRQVKAGLEHEGLTGLGEDVMGVQPLETRVQHVHRRERFRNRNIFLPKVLHRDGEHWRDLDYQRHILAAIDWASLVAAGEPGLIGATDGPSSETVNVDLGKASGPGYQRVGLNVDTTLSLSWFTRQITDLVPNPWQAARIAGDLIKTLREYGFDENEIYNQRRVQASKLRTSVADQVTKQAEIVFRNKLKNGEIRFDLEAGKPNFRMFDEYELTLGPLDHTLEDYGRPMQRSLFDPVYERQFDSDLEKRYAFYLDQQEMIQWWHRIAVRQQHEYYLRGWKPDRIWPDFVAMSSSDKKSSQLLIVETKGRHLDNPETGYKRNVFHALEEWLNRGRTYECGMVQVDDGPAKGKFTIVFKEEDFPSSIFP